MAIQDMTALLDIDPDRDGAYFFRGMAYYLTGSPDMCREDMEYFLQISSDPEYTAYAEEVLRSIK